MSSQYLGLTEYSSKHKVSVSTLRRRIRAEELKYVFEDGKYLILDDLAETHASEHRPSPVSEKKKVGSAKVASVSAVALQKSALPKLEEIAKTLPVVVESARLNQEQETALASANKLLAELKRAYTQILQEKEEQILHLNEEISDLKTLVRVFESDFQKQKRRVY
jgi:hypothetical protein